MRLGRPALFVVLFLCACVTNAFARQGPSHIDPDRAPAPARGSLATSPPSPDGPVRLPADLVLQAIREVEEQIPPDDRPGDPSYQSRSAPIAAGSGPLRVAGFGANVRINDLGGGPSNAEAEVSVAAIGARLIAGWNDGQFFGIQPGFTGWGYSMDGGATWTDGGGLPVATATDVYYGDPVLASDPAGHFYFANLYRPVANTYGISVNHGTFAGAVPSWDPPVLIASSAADFLDKPWVGVDPAGGNAYVAYIRFLGGGGQRLEFARSTNHGVSWSVPVALTNAATSSPMAPRITVGPAGQVYVAYYAYDSGVGKNYHRIRSSLDGGVTFGAETNIGGREFFDNYFSGPAGFNREREVALVSLAVDRSYGPNRGHLYAVWEEMVNAGADPLGGALVPEVEDDGSSATSTPFTLGNTLTGNLSSTSDQDWWSFAGTAGQTVIFYLQPNASACNGFLRLFAGGGAVANRCAFSHFDPGVGIVVFTLPTTGTYYLRVLNWDGVAADVGNYRVFTGTHTAVPADIARDHRDVLFSSSADGGATWSMPRVVNDEPGLFDDCFPEVVVDGLGKIYVDWYDHRRDAANGILTDIDYTSSGNGGTSFAASALINDGGAINWNLVSTNVIPNMGDYSAMFAEGANVYANWADGRDGTPDSYFAVLSDRPAAVDHTPEPASLALLGAWPEAPGIRVSFSLPAAGAASLELFDLVGRRVAGGSLAHAEAGQHEVLLAADRALPSGVYLVRLRQGAQSALVKAALLR